MMNGSLAAVLQTTLHDRQLLSHPFYRRWEAGQLTRDELTLYAEQYRYFEEMLPLFLERLANQLPEGPARNAVLENLDDEVAPPSHLDLFEQFAQFYEAAFAPISPAMKSLVDSYFGLLQKSPAASLAGLWAYESQGARIADSKAQGLIEHYGAPSDAVAFWSAHGGVEDDHARWTLEALDGINPDPLEAEAAARLIGGAWWEFLDERDLVSSQRG
jgi:pyrroloquinoline-quinone synthase